MHDQSALHLRQSGKLSIDESTHINDLTTLNK
jgi:hypothetical protein